MWLVGKLPDMSRARIQTLIKAGNVTVDGAVAKPHAKVKPGMEAQIEIPPGETPTALVPENIPVDVIYEDSDIIVVNKPAGLVVHPGAGHATGTLANALLFRCPDLAGIRGEKRPGMVHRLDMDTSGVLVVAKNDRAMMKLTAQFARRQVHKEYLAVVAGVPTPAEGRIETLIGRSQSDRKRMSVLPASGGRRAVSRYTVEESFDEAALLRVVIETGRTHQIRVHMAHIGHPVLGDSQYGRPERIAKNVEPPERQMLHAETLGIIHPTSKERLVFRAAMPDDMQNLILRLRGTTAVKLR